MAPFLLISKDAMNKPMITSILITLGAILVAVAASAADIPGVSTQPGRIEAQVLEAINTARANPAADVERLGLNATAQGDVSLDTAAFPGAPELSPLTWNQELSNAARLYGEDMFARVFYGHVSPDGQVPEDRIRATGYAPAVCAESIGGIAFINIIPAEQAASIITDNLLSNAFRKNAEGAPLLSPYYTEVGIAFVGGQLEFNGQTYNVYIIVMEFARPLPDDAGAIWGHVFQDKNGNGRYDAGEGIGSEEVSLTGLLNFGFSPTGYYLDRLDTGSDGTYFFEVPVGTFRIELQGPCNTCPASVDLESYGVSKRIDIEVPMAGIQGTGTGE